MLTTYCSDLDGRWTIEIVNETTIGVTNEAAELGIILYFRTVVKTLTEKNGSLFDSWKSFYSILLSRVATELLRKKQFKIVSKNSIISIVSNTYFKGNRYWQFESLIKSLKYIRANLTNTESYLWRYSELSTLFTKLQLTLITGERLSDYPT